MVKGGCGVKGGMHGRVAGETATAGMHSCSEMFQQRLCLCIVTIQCCVKNC